MARTPTGTITSVATAFSAAKTVSGISNAAEAVVSATAHGLSNGDIVEITSGWGRLNKRAFRVKGVTTDAFVLEKASTTNTDFYPAGGGAGSVRKATTWVQGDRTLNHSTSGGDPKEVNVKFIESDVEIVLNDGEVAKLGNHVLLPGMPVEAFIETGSRSPMSYLLKPFTDYFKMAFREQ